MVSRFKWHALQLAHRLEISDCGSLQDWMYDLLRDDGVDCEVSGSHELVVKIADISFRLRIHSECEDGVPIPVDEEPSPEPKQLN